MQRQKRHIVNFDFTLDEIKAAADYNNMCYTCSTTLVMVGESGKVGKWEDFQKGHLQKLETNEDGFIRPAIKVTKNYLRPKVEYLSIAGLRRVNSGKTALESIDFTLLGAEVGLQGSSTAAEVKVAFILAGGSASVFDVQLGVGLSTGGGIMDDSLVVKVAGTGLSLGRKTGLCIFDNCFSVDFGKLFN